MKMTFKKAGLAAALAASSAIVAPGAMAASVTATNAYPSLAGEPFVGAPASKLRVALTGAVTVGDINLSVRFYDASQNLIVQLDDVADNTANAGQIVYSLPSAAAIGGDYKYVALVLEADGGTDDFGTAPGDAAWVSPDDGSMQAVANKAAAVAAVHADGDVDGDKDGLIAVNADYNGLALVSAQADEVPAATEIFLQFNADVFNAAGGAVTGLANADAVVEVYTDVAANTETEGALAGDKVVAGITVPDSVIRIETDDGAAFTGGARAVKVSNAISSGLTDGASNLILSATKTISALQRPAYATSGVVAVEGNDAAAAGLYDEDGVSTTPAVYVRLSQPVAAASFNAATDVEVKAGTTTLAVNAAGLGVENDASGSPTILKIALTAQGGAPKAFRVADGKLQYTADNTVATPVWTDVTVKVLNDSANTPIEHAYSAAVEVSASLAAETVNAGSAEAPEIETADADTNGIVDGFTVDFTQPIAAPFSATGFTVTEAADATNELTAAFTAADAAVTGTIAEATLLGLDAVDNDATKLATDIDNADVPFAVTVADAAATYSAVYDWQTGSLRALRNVASANDIADGAAPVLTSDGVVFKDAETAGEGVLELTFSETIADGGSDNNAAGSADADQVVLINGVPLSVYNLNADVKKGVTASVTGGDTLRVANVAALSTTDKVSIATDPKSVYEGTNDDVAIASAADGVAVTEGDKTFDQPEMVNAYVVNDAESGKAEKIVVQYSKDIKLAEDDTAEGLFKVRVYYVDSDDAETYAELAIAADNVSIVDDTVTLTLPALLPDSVTDMVVEYNPANGNKLISTDEPAADAATNNLAGIDELDEIDDASDIDNMTSDENTQFVNGDMNAAKLYSMTLKGTLDGIKNGTLLRADIVGTVGQFTDGSTATATYTTNGVRETTQVALGASADLLNKAAAAGQVQVPMTLSVARDGNGNVSVSLGDQSEAAPGAGSTRIPVNVNSRNGAISGNGVTGNIAMQPTMSAVADSTAYVVFEDVSEGAQDFQLSVATDQTVLNGIVMMSYKAPGVDSKWLPLTNGEPSMANYVAFAQDIMSKGQVKDLGTIETAKIKPVFVNDKDFWQLIGVEGDINATGRGNLQSAGLMIGTNDLTGAPALLFADNDLDEMFSLVGNRMQSAIELTASQRIDAINPAYLTENTAFAVRNPATSIDGYIGLPVTGDDAEGNLPAGWSLITVSGNDVPENVTMIIRAGNDNEVQTWVKGEDAPSWLKAGNQVFVYADRAIAQFDFFKN